MSETVYVTVPATGETVRLYVVADQTTWTDGDPLTDVSGDGYEELTLSTDGTQVVKLWDPPLTLGDYDIVEDKNRNGVYDEGIDVVDSITLVGVDVIPEFSTLTSILLMFVVLTVAMAIHKRRPLKTPIH